MAILANLKEAESHERAVREVLEGFGGGRIDVLGEIVASKGCMIYSLFSCRLIQIFDLTFLCLGSFASSGTRGIGLAC